MGWHLFVDESKQSRYLLVVVAVPSSGAAELRRVMKGFLLRGQRRVHFRKEADSRRRAILAALSRLGLSVWVFSSTSRSERSARTSCLIALMQAATQVSGGGTVEIVIERDAAAVDGDHRVLRAARANVEDLRELHYELRPAHEDAGLWAPDAIAWAVQRGSDWRRRIENLGLEWAEVD